MQETFIRLLLAKACELFHALHPLHPTSNFPTGSVELQLVRVHNPCRRQDCVRDLDFSGHVAVPYCELQHTLVAEI